MTGWDILQKSVSQIYYNLTDAIRITGLLWAVSFAVSMVPTLLLDTASPTTPGTMAINAVAVVIDFACVIWIAVLWHRFMLLEEQVNSLLPKWHPDQMWDYFKWALLIMVIIFAVAIIPFAIFSLISGTLFGISIWLSYAIMLIMATFLYYFSLRISLILPAIAVNNPIGIGQSWRVTEAGRGAILMASLILVLITIAVTMLIGLAGTSQFVTLIGSFIIEWISVMLGVSLLTTLYGHLMENRPLN